MAEWLIAPVLKTGIVLNKELSRVRIPLSPFARWIESFFYWFFPDRYHKERRMARLSHLAKPEKNRLEKIKLDRNE